MARFLVLLAVVVVLGYVAKERWARLRDRLGKWPPAEASQPRGRELVACSMCGVHVPRARAFKAHGTPERAEAGSPWLYCSETCRRLAASAPDLTRSKSA